jgi:hypothetical protein
MIRPMPGNPIYLFLHLFKTGGTTINGHLARHLAWDEEFVHLGPWGDRVRARDGSPDPADWDADRWSRVRVAAGHRVDGTTHLFVPDREARYLTIVRDPADLLVSRYNFYASRTGDTAGFWAWYERRAPNPTLRRLRTALRAPSFEVAREALDRFWFVGATEHLDDDLGHLFAAIGVPPNWVNRRVTGGNDDLDDLDMGRETFPVRRHVVADAEMRERIHDENRKDLRLHRYALDRRAALREQYGWS